MMEGFERGGAAAVDRGPGGAHEQNAEVKVQGQRFYRILQKVIEERQITVEKEYLEAVAAVCEAEDRLTRGSCDSPLQGTSGREPPRTEEPRPEGNSAEVHSAAMHGEELARRAAAGQAAQMETAAH